MKVLKKINSYKTILCTLNFVIGFYVLTITNELNAKVFSGLIIVSFGPIFWNRWLYDELFSKDDKKSKPILSFETFNFVSFFLTLLVFIAFFHAWAVN